MAELHDFFVASVGAASALIGLLFVAITLAPDKVFGEGADPERRSGAVGAFTALANIFFVSLAALAPRSPEVIIAIIPMVSIVRVIAEGRTVTRLYPLWRWWQRFGLISLGIYILELVLATRAAMHVAPPEGLVYTVMGLYAYSLATAWTLLGARDAVKRNYGPPRPPVAP